MTDLKTRIAVIDYGMGNLHSAAKALEHVAPTAQVLITDDPADLARVDRIVFPGVGAIRDCMAELKRSGFDEAIIRAVQEKPVLAICVGMQALMEFSEENDGVDCLGLLPGRVEYFGEVCRQAGSEHLKVPHMGWNKVHQTSEHPMWKDIPQDTRFYFVHSYYVRANDDIVSATCEYGKTFAAALHRDNLFAVQFHPEKSHLAGLQLLKNFVSWSPGS